jgi:RNA ligase
MYILEYLRSGKTLADLETEFGIKGKVDASGKLVNLKYSQIDSPKTHEIVRECRGLILEMNTWNIIARPFLRFFNYGEALELTSEFDFTNAYALEKCDGSLITCFYYDNEWRMSTSGTIDGSGSVGFCNMSFYDLFWKTAETYKLSEKMDSRYTYTFELMSPLNRVVTRYTENSLALLNARDTNNNHKELNYDELEKLSNSIGVRLPKRFSMNSIIELQNLFNEIDALEEGFVCIDYSKEEPNNPGCFPRVKVKNPSYVALHHLKDSTCSSVRGFLQVVINGEIDELVGYFPEYESYLVKIKDEYDNYISGIEKAIEDNKELFLAEKTPENRKAFALQVKSIQGSSYIFRLYNGQAKSVKELIQNDCGIKGIKCIARGLMKVLKLDNLGIALDSGDE